MSSDTGFEGGQGRSAEDVMDGGSTMLAWAVLTVVFNAGLFLGYFLFGGGGQ
jgi:hypothetical protein